MNLPARDDHNSLVVIAVMFTCEKYFWLTALWFPIVAVAQLVHRGLNEGLTTLDFVKLLQTLMLFACAAAILRLTFRGLVNGRAIAYVAMAVVFVVRAAIKIVDAVEATPYMRPRYLGMAVTWVALAVLLSVIAGRGGTSGEPSA